MKFKRTKQYHHSSRSLYCKQCQKTISSIIKPDEKEWNRFVACKCATGGQLEKDKKSIGGKNGK